MRRVGLIIVAVGAVGAVGLMLYSGRNSSQSFLKLLFTIWVLSPFMLLLLWEVCSKRWAAISGTILYWAMLVVAVGTIGVFGSAVLESPESIPTRVFVATPPISWLVIAAFIGYAAWISRRQSRISKP